MDHGVLIPYNELIRLKVVYEEVKLIGGLKVEALQRFQRMPQRRLSPYFVILLRGVAL